jgi:glycerol-3-phosphate O-acyltransferase
LIATAILANASVTGAGDEGRAMSIEELSKRVDELARLLKGEFQLKSETDVEFEVALGRLVDGGEVLVEGEGAARLVRAQRDDGGFSRLRFQAGLLHNFLESYRIAVRSLTLLIDGPMPAKDLARRTLSMGDRMFLTGDVVQRESVCKPNLENALQSFREAGYLTGGEGGPQRLAAGFETPEALTKIEQGLVMYLHSSDEI